MATRNHTKKFESLRAQFKKKREGHVGRSYGYDADGGARLLPSDTEETDRAGLTHSFPPQWVNIVDSIQADVNLIQDKLTDLHNLHDNRLKVTFGEDEKEKEKEIDILTHEITRLIKQSDNNIKRIATVGNDPGTNLPKEERVVRLNVMRNLAITLHDLSKKFRHAQKDFLIRLRSQEEVSTHFFSSESGDNSISFDEAVERGLNDKQLLELKDMEKHASEREKEILNIARSINDLAAIFRELNVLVIEQGTILDRIDYNVEQTLVKVKEGVVQLKQADEYSKKARTLKCIIALIVMIIILVAILVYRLKKK